jgi:8-oxo-dGTP pyrophosphatase MutT (NUDIX family)
VRPNGRAIFAGDSFPPDDLTIMPTPRLPTVRQRSAGGVAYRRAAGRIEVALIRVGPEGRWQLPKGIVDRGERPEHTAVREVREEAGIDARIVRSLDVIEYWYVGNDAGGRRVRFHKFVHLYLLEYLGGDVRDHDHEVDEARWVVMSEAEAMLSFQSERKAFNQAVSLIGETPPVE